MPVGWLLGLAIGHDGRVLDSDWLLPVTIGRSRCRLTLFEAELRELAGRFVAIDLSAEGRVYLDGCGSLAVVYCPDLERVASSPGLIPRTPSTGDDESLIRALGLPESDAWYPFGLTPRHGVERLLPNHYLDLTRWTAYRHWPPSDLAAGTAEPAAAVAAIGSLIERTIAGVTRAYPAQMAADGRAEIPACFWPVHDPTWLGSAATRPADPDASSPSSDCRVGANAGPPARARL